MWPLLAQFNSGITTASNFRKTHLKVVFWEMEEITLK